MSPLRVTSRLAISLFATALFLTGCGQGSSSSGGSVTPAPTGSGAGSPTSGSGAVPGTGGTSTGSPTPRAAGATDLTIVVDDGAGARTTWHLTCDPAGGDHPDPAKACAVLAQHGATALPPVPRDRMCTQVFGGAQTAHITGTWRGEKVDARLSRTNGCEITRWQALIGLLPRGDT